MINARFWDPDMYIYVHKTCFRDILILGKILQVFPV